MSSDKYVIDNFSHLPHTIPGATETDAGVMTAAQVRKLDQGSSWFNVMTYGATGDGVTDDGPAVQRTIDAYEAGGGKGTIYFPRPSASYRIVTPVVTNLGVANPFLRVFGDGAVITCASPGNDCLNFGALVTLVEGLVLQGDGVTTVLRGLVVTGESNTVRNCFVRNVMATWAAIAGGGTQSEIVDVTMNGSTCGIGIIWVFAIQAFLDNISGTDGVINGSPCWIFLDTQPPFDVYRLCRNISCDESNGSWIKAGQSGVFSASRIAVVDINSARGIKNDLAPCISVSDTDRLTVRNFTPELAGQFVTLDLHSVTKAKIEDVATIVLSPNSPVSILRADNACGYVEVVESSFDAIDSSATHTVHIVNGQRTEIVPGGAVALSPGLLMKLDGANPGQYTPALKTDSPSLVVGSLILGPAVSSTTFAMPAVAAFNQALWPAFFFINDDSNASATIGLFALSDPAHGFAGLKPVDLTGLVTAAQVAAAFSAAINAATGVGFSVTSTVDGLGNITIKNTTLGSSGDRQTTGATFPNNGQAALLTPNSGALVGGQSNAEVNLLAGQIYPIQIDGVDVIAIGDKLTLSTTTDGQAKKVVAGTYLFTATAASAATAGALVNAIYQPGTI